MLTDGGKVVSGVAGLGARTSQDKHGRWHTAAAPGLSWHVCGPTPLPPPGSPKWDCSGKTLRWVAQRGGGWRMGDGKVLQGEAKGFPPGGPGPTLQPLPPPLRTCFPPVTEVGGLDGVQHQRPRAQGQAR